MPSTTPLRTVMTTDVVTVTADQTLAQAADVLAERGIGAAPVVDAAGTVLQISVKNAQPVEYGEPLFTIAAD